MMLKHIAHARAERALAGASIEAKTVFSQYIIVYGVFTVLKNAHRARLALLLSSFIEKRTSSPH
jgi:hypothetical protein